jgi:quinolinate synthase
LQNESPEIFVDAEIAKRAILPIQRMLDMSK